MTPLPPAEIKGSRGFGNANFASPPRGLEIHPMKTIADWLDEYGESHRNPTNKTIHRIAVPVIALDMLGLVHALPIPGAAVFATLAALAYYWRLSPALALGMGGLAGVALPLLAGAELALGAAFLPALVAVFVVAWAAQFYGHSVEGAKPSFAKDLQFLLIGPLWLLADAYRRFGLRYAPAGETC